MASRRTSRVALLGRTTAAGQGNENDISTKAPAHSGAPGLSKVPTGAQKPAATASRVALSSRTTTLAVKSSNVVASSSNTSQVGFATRKRNVLHETTNSNAAPLKTTRAATTSAIPTSSKAATSSARRYGTRSSIGGTARELGAVREGDVEIEDAVMMDASSVMEQRPIKPMRRTTVASAHVAKLTLTNSAAVIRQRRIEAEERAARAAQELEEARRAEEEHRSKKARTSEPDFDDDLSADGDGGLEDEVEDVTQGMAKGPSQARDEGWQDLDEGDEEDPLMVTEYVVEVYDYLRKLELTTMPNPDYMQEQNEVTWKMRGILIDWLIEIHTKFRLLPETIFLTTNIIDRLLSANVVSLVKFQLVGVTALFIASKYEEVTCPSVQNFLYVTDGGYADDEILRAERYMLGVLDFNLSYPNPIHFLRRISKADGYDIHSRTMAKYLMEISIVDHKFLATPPSLVAAAGSWLARLILDKGPWNANLVHYSGYTEEELKPTAQLMLDYIVRTSSLANPSARSENPLRPGVRAEEPEHPNFIKKYAAKKFFKASLSVRKWAEATFAPREIRNPVTLKVERVPTPAVL